MGKNLQASILPNIIEYSNGNINFVSASNLLMQISSSGEIITTGIISGSNALSSSYALNSEKLDNLDSTSFVFTSSFNSYSSSVSTRVTDLESTASILTTASSSFAVVSSSFASTSASAASRVTKIEGNYATTGSNAFNGSQNITGSLTVSQAVIAQTLNVQQVTSSIVYSCGSNIFGCSTSDVQQMTGSVRITGSLSVNTTSGFTIGDVAGKRRIQYGTDQATSFSLLTDTNGYAGIYACSGIFSQNLCADKGYFTGISLGGTPTSATTSATQIRFTNSGGDLYIGQEGSVAGAFYPGASAYDNVIYTNCPVNIITGGTSRMKLFNSGITCFQNTVCAPTGIFSGCVGIGQTSPTFGLEVYSNLGTAITSNNTFAANFNLIFNRDNTGGTRGCFNFLADQNAGYIQTIDNYPIVFGTNNIERMRISNCGFVAIGVSPSNWCCIGHGRAIEVGCQGLGIWGRNFKEVHLINNYYYAPTTTRAYAYCACASDYEQFDGAHAWYTAPYGSPGNAVSFNSRFQIFNNGVACFACQVCAPHFIGVNNISIGSSCTTSDGYNTRLRITCIANDTFVFSFNNQACKAIMYMYGGNTNNPQGYTAWVDNASGNTNHLIGHTVAQATYFATQGGRVGIGTTTPCTVLSVNSGINTSSANAISIMQNTNGANKDAAAFGVAINNGGESTNAADLYISTATGGSLRERLRITSGGLILACSRMSSILGPISNIQEWVGEIGALTNGSKFNLFCIANQYDNLIVDLFAYINLGSFTTMAYRFGIGYNLDNTYTSQIGNVTFVCGEESGTQYFETFCWKNCSGSNISSARVALRVFGYGVGDNPSSGGNNLICTTCLTRIY